MTEFMLLKHSGIDYTWLFTSQKEWKRFKKMELQGRVYIMGVFFYQTLNTIIDLESRAKVFANFTVSIGSLRIFIDVLFSS